MAEKEYIDREILLKMNFYTANCNSEENRWNDYAIKDIIRHIPAADVAPVKHGHWEYDKHFRFAECSECEAEFYICDLEEISGDGFINFCPYCGAKMDGGDST